MTPSASESTDTKSAATLSDFIKGNSQLITGVAAFIGLTAFSAQLKDKDLQTGVPAASLFGAFLLLFELLANTPAPPRHWRVTAFEMILVLLLFSVGWYWVETFPSIWLPLIVFLIMLVLFFGIIVGIAHVLTKTFVFIAKRFCRKRLDEKQILRFSRIVLLVTTVIACVGFVWASNHLSKYPLKIQLYRPAGVSKP